MLEVQNLSVTARNGAQLLKQISFQLETGEAVGLTGQSGAGKTTLLKALLGILSGGCQVSGGTIQVDGQSLWALSPRKRRELCGTTLGFIPQNPMTAFDPRLKLGRQMEETLRLRTGVSGKTSLERAETLLADLGLSQPRRVLNSYPAQLSGGMLQRAAAALLLALHPRYILAGASGTAAGKRWHLVYLPRCCRTPRPLRDGLCDGTRDADRTGDDAGTFGTPKAGVDQGICRGKPPGEQGGMDMDGLIAEHISKTYAGAHGLSFAALRDVSLHLEPGSFTSLVGESGSGKSTLARLLVGMEPPDQGTISLERRELEKAAYKTPGGLSGRQRDAESHALCPQQCGGGDGQSDLPLKAAAPGAHWRTHGTDPHGGAAFGCPRPAVIRRGAAAALPGAGHVHPPQVSHSG